MSTIPLDEELKTAVLDYLNELEDYSNVTRSSLIAAMTEKHQWDLNTKKVSGEDIVDWFCKLTNCFTVLGHSPWSFDRVYRK